MVLGVASWAGRPEAVKRVVGGRVVVVSGASRGIGEQVSRRLAGVGARVIGVARGAEALERLADEITGRGGWFQPLVGDLRDLEWAESAGERIVREHGAPELVVSNAGHSIHRYLADYTGRFHDVVRTAGVNYLGAVGLALPLLQAMMGRGRGHLIAVSTVNVGMPMPGWSVYNASKAAYEQWLTCVAPELRAHGVAATSIRLPRVATAMSAPTAGRYPVPELSVEQAADVVCRAIVTRPRVVAPWWSRAGAVLSAGWPEGVQLVWEAALQSGWRP